MHIDKSKKGYSRVYDIGVDLSQGLDLDCTEAAVRVNTISVSHSVRNEKIKAFMNIVCLYLSLELTINW